MKNPKLAMVPALLCAVILAASPAEAKRYYIKAVAWCTDCSDTTRIPLRTTGRGFATKAECEKGKREFVAVVKRNGLRVRASCNVK